MATVADLMPKLYNENKMQEVANLYTLDAKIMPPGHPIVTGREGIKIAFQKAYEIANGIEMKADEVIELEDQKTILERGSCRLLKDGQLFDDGKYLFVRKKIDGEWLIYIDIYNSNGKSDGSFP